MNEEAYTNENECRVGPQLTLGAASTASCIECRLNIADFLAVDPQIFGMPPPFGGVPHRAEVPALSPRCAPRPLCTTKAPEDTPP